MPRLLGFYVNIVYLFRNFIWANVSEYLTAARALFNPSYKYGLLFPDEFFKYACRFHWNELYRICVPGLSGGRLYNNTTSNVVDKMSDEKET